MLSPNEAHAAILERIEALSEVETVPLAEAVGRCLAQAAVADVDMPPFEKSMMDGFAMRASDLAQPGALRCVGESRAGVPFEGEVPAGACVAIYTGAELPAECDAVEMVERTRREGDSIHFEAAVRLAQNVEHKGDILTTGRAVYEPPHRIGSADLSVLASIGCDPVPVVRRPTVSVLTTGDELVPARERPGVGQIREGNTLYLQAACQRFGHVVRRHGIVRDDAAELEAAFGEALEHGDALITTGGVSVGKYDLVGATFERLGVEPVLHKVAIKPGKPIWFGMLGAKPVFGLPGNPVSSLLGLEAFVRPALARLAGAPEDEQAMRTGTARWTGPRRTAKDRQWNVPARLRHGADGVLELEGLPFKGSADIVNAARADALAIVPAEGVIETGQLVTFRPLGA